MHHGEESPPSIGLGLSLTMAFAAGFAVANIYYNQPILAITEHDLGHSNLARPIPISMQIDFTAGSYLMVPPG